jgi:uncharacterized protein (TIGR02001 family)
MNTPVKRLLPLASLAAIALLPALHAHADAPPDSAAAPAAGWTLSANAGAVSQYVSRGFRQTWGRPALQAGLDLTHPNGW